MNAHSHQAPELRVNDWIDGEGNALEQPVRLADLGDGYKIVFCFQHWCPGCHSQGFPTMRYLQDKLADSGVGMVAIQTVFEGAEQNTFDKLRIDQDKYGMTIPFGQDLPLPGRTHPTFMEDYGTGGTPWFTVIDPDGNVVFADFRLNPQRLVEVILDEQAVAEG